MSYDLSFLVPAGARVPTTAELEDYFRGRPGYRIEGQQAIYGNEDTGVYFMFDLFAPEKEDEEPGEDESGPAAPEDGLQPVPLSFNVNYVRPSVFGLEAERELSALVERFGFSVDDPQVQGMGRGPYSPAGFLDGWQAGNALGYRVAVDQIKKEPGSEGSFFNTVLPAAELQRCWRWNVQRNDLQRELGEDVFVPRISFLRRDGGIRSFVVWGDAMSVALPDVDLLMLVRQQLAPRRFFFFQPQDVVVARFAELAPLFALGTQAASPVPHRLFRYTSPPAELQDFFKSRPPFRGGQVGVAVEKILDAEMIQAALAR